PQQSKDILENPIYQQFSQNFGGGQEYGGMSRLYQINQANEYDIIILDTPPSQHAIDFINAPAQLKDFFSQSVLKFFLPEENDRSAAAQIISKGSGFALKVLQKLTGSNFIEDLSSFLSNFQGMYEAFRKQSDHVSALLEDSLTGFLIISGAEKPQLLDSSILYQKLSQMNLPFRGLIVNKSTPPREIEVASTSLPLNIQKRVNELFEQYKQQINYEDQIINELVQQFKKPAFVQKVSSLSHDVYNVETLLQFSHYLTNPISYKTI
ncbi:MAG: anion-transporting ArsA/GET3 family ATPase, partial [bacterium]